MVDEAWFCERLHKYILKVNGQPQLFMKMSVLLTDLSFADIDIIKYITEDFSHQPDLFDPSIVQDVSQDPHLGLAAAAISTSPVVKQEPDLQFTFAQIVHQ